MSEKVEDLLKGMVSKIEELGKRLDSAEGKKELPRVNQPPIPNNTTPPITEQPAQISPIELNDPLQPNVSRLNKMDENGRILKLYSARYPEGGIF